MKKIVLSLAMLLSFGVANSWAQTNPVNPDGTKDLYRHKTNSGSTGAEVPEEAIDYVTIGSTMKYFVMPDAIINPDFDKGDGTVDWSKLNSTFTWKAYETATPTNTVTVTPETGKPALVTINWAAKGEYTVEVMESIALGQTCDGAATKIPVEVIAAPTADWDKEIHYYCTTNGDNIQIPVDLTSASPADQKVTVKITLTNEAGNPVETFAPKGEKEISYDNISTDKSDLLDLGVSNLDKGRYTVTINSVSDRISRKSSVAVTPEAAITLVVYETKTGAIYHVPNIPKK